MFINRILTFVIYFSTGFFIPVLSRFLMKFYPCSIHSYFGDILKFYFNKKRHKVKYNNYKLNLLKKQYFYNRLLWGFGYLLLFSTLEYLSPIYAIRLSFTKISPKVILSSCMLKILAFFSKINMTYLSSSSLSSTLTSISCGAPQIGQLPSAAGTTTCPQIWQRYFSTIILISLT